MSGTNEKVPFRLIACPDCNHQVCWVNPRLPSFCSACGHSIYLRLRNGEGILFTCDAWLRMPHPLPTIEQSALIACEGNPAACKRPEAECPCMIDGKGKRLQPSHC